MSSIGLFMYHDRGSELALDAIDWLTSRGHEVRLSNDQAATLGHTELGVPEAQLSAGLDLMVSLGGDGTMLRAVDLAAADSVPVLGINLGQLGYLTEVEPSGVRMALKRFLAGSYSIEERMRLEVTVHRSGAETERLTALNEAVLEKSEMGHTVRLDVELDGLPFTSYVSDGLILATPTGSTAYAFSARGPIVAPTHRAIMLTPVSPHMLFDRTLVLEPGTELRITVAGHRPAALSVDGRMLGELRRGDGIVATAASHAARLVIFSPRDFHQILKSKFGLSDR